MHKASNNLTNPKQIPVLRPDFFLLDIIRRLFTRRPSSSGESLPKSVEFLYKILTIVNCPPVG